MPKSPIISGKRLVKRLLRNGFILVRQKGSHCFISRLDNSVFTVVPVHANQDLGKGLLLQILDDLNLSVEQFQNLK
jgi:predicted RNA binding protein YcfA (HicA-like mRNA interferase family)